MPMTTLFTATISVPTAASSIGGSRRSEAAYIEQILHTIAQKIGSGAKLSDTIHPDSNGAAVASYTYTPIASA